MIRKTVMAAIAILMLTSIGTLKGCTTLPKLPEGISSRMIEIEEPENNFVMLAGRTRESVITTQIEEFLIDTEIKEQELLAEKARIEAERIAKIEAEIQRITNSNTRKNNINFDTNNVTKVSGISVGELNQIFDAKGVNEMKVLTQAIVDAEATYGVNAFFLSALAAQESGWGKKPAGNGTNFTGYAVYSSQHSGKTFDSIYQNIMNTAKLLKNSYLTPSGPYYNGLSVYDVNTRYCLHEDMKTTDYGWSKNITRIATDLKDTYHSKIKNIEEVPTLQ